MLARGAVEAKALDTNVAGLMGRAGRQRALDRSRTTALSIVDTVHAASRARLDVRASLVAVCVAMGELNIGILVDGNLHVGDGGLLAGDRATAGDGYTAALAHGTSETFGARASITGEKISLALLATEGAVAKA